MDLDTASKTGFKGQQALGRQLLVFSSSGRSAWALATRVRAARESDSGTLWSWLSWDFPPCGTPSIMCYAHIRPRNLIWFAGFHGLEFKQYANVSRYKWACSPQPHVFFGYHVDLSGALYGG